MSVPLSSISKKIDNTDNDGFVKYITIGDSFIDSNQSFAVQAVARAQYCFIDEFGYSGKRSDEVYNNILTDGALTSGANRAIIALGQNDIAQSRTPKQFFDSICQIIDVLKENGIAPELTYISANALYKTKVSSFNLVLLYACYLKKVRVYDVFSKYQIADGSWDLTYSDDGLHPNKLCKQLASKDLYLKLQNGISDIYIPNCMDQDDCLISNPIFVGDDNVDGIANTWVQFGTASTKTLVPYLAGNKQKIAVSSQSDTYLYTSINFTALAGHNVLAVCQADMEMGADPRLSIRLVTTPWRILADEFQSDGSDFKFMKILNIPIGASAGQAYIAFRDTLGASTASVYGYQVIDLTALGIA